MQTLRVGAALSDPPFNAMPGGGLDVDLMTEIARALGMAVEFVPYDGADFDGIFDALTAGAYDCVASCVTVTPRREERAAFVPPYLVSGQALAVAGTRHPSVRSVDDLAGLTIGVQRGDPGQPIAERLAGEGKAARVRVYDYGAVHTTLRDLSTGGCDAVIKLAPVLAELVKSVAGVDVVQRGLSVERIAVAVAPGEREMLTRIGHAQARLEDDGALQRIRRRWLGNPYRDHKLAGL